MIVCWACVKTEERAMMESTATLVPVQRVILATTVQQVSFEFISSIYITY